MDKKLLSIEKANQKFNLYFKTSALRFIDPLMTEVTRRYNINIIAFDDYLHKQGYAEESHGSMKEYISSIYGKDAMKFIISLLILRPKVIKRRSKKRK